MNKEMELLQRKLYHSYVNNMIFYEKQVLSYHEWLREVNSVKLPKERSEQ